MSQMKLLDFSAWQLWICLVFAATVYVVIAAWLIHSCQALKLSSSFVTFFKHLGNQSDLEKDKYQKCLFINGIFFEIELVYRVPFHFKIRKLCFYSCRKLASASAEKFPGRRQRKKRPKI